ncbi:exodeoxyribonuclease VII small subunit [Oceanospirillaceae bacterium]|jgi:exodeoxyribonuclease VII small subunit|uniref:exodeoxyribonuclease VII small subunit n=1 Tax=Candidatus Njordibacter sp. Uisw_002 TaxID=3230971 RepID=UPI0023745617|nr:exodeoxyribonuclease VII small subunit [Oceanospirillaceae bacterium]MDB9753207.1 exodeoxyribonuclease VII small subunit [Oceanospirillaceae bacterium]MDC1340404.1 exodeoxyribonuclease VII small subunit [Oceanospirillaceae bacterium]|tara:strand:+ start:3491 stop:3736 length:246 start_codon:yes stop_codon:yes gene_type:complete
MTKKEQVSAFNFEASLAELEALVQQMEQGDLTLENSLAAFERGISLTRGCQTALAQAEQKVNVLMQDAQGKVVEQPFSKES